MVTAANATTIVKRPRPAVVGVTFTAVEGSSSIDCDLSQRDPAKRTTDHELCQFFGSVPQRIGQQ
jgi:hypothetical protein